MTAPIVIACGEPERRDWQRGTSQSRRGRVERERGQARAAALSVERPRGRARLKFTGYGSGRTIFGACGPVASVSGVAGIVVPVPVDEIGRQHCIAIPRLNFRRPLGRPATLSFGNARFQACKQSSRRAAYVLHGFNSFRDASASCLQRATGERGNARNPFGEIRNVQR